MEQVHADWNTMEGVFAQWDVVREQDQPNDPSAWSLGWCIEQVFRDWQVAVALREGNAVAVVMARHGLLMALPVRWSAHEDRVLPSDPVRPSARAGDVDVRAAQEDLFDRALTEGVTGRDPLDLIDALIAPAAGADKADPSLRTRLVVEALVLSLPVHLRAGAEMLLALRGFVRLTGYRRLDGTVGAHR